jgi:hypothetical protein
MILAAIASPLLALAIFCDSLRAPKRRDVRAERQAASARLSDGPRVNALVFYSPKESE